MVAILASIFVRVLSGIITALILAALFNHYKPNAMQGATATVAAAC